MPRRDVSLAPVPEGEPAPTRTFEEARMAHPDRDDGRVYTEAKPTGGIIDMKTGKPITLDEPAPADPEAEPEG